MLYMVILDANSPVGEMYAAGDNDGFTSGPTRNPILTCTEIATDSPYYIYAKRILKKEAGSHQSLFLPHGSIVMILQYDEKDPNPLGFLSRNP